MTKPVAEEERQLVAAARHAAAGLRISASPEPLDWMAFCWGFARDIYPPIDRGQELEDVRATLAAVVDACLRVSPPALAQERLAFLLGLVRGEEALRDSDQQRERPKASLSELIPPAARAAMEVVWRDEAAALRAAQAGY